MAAGVVRMAETRLSAERAESAAALRLLSEQRAAAGAELRAHGEAAERAAPESHAAKLAAAS